jgi:hypothetical protein
MSPSASTAVSLDSTLLASVTYNIGTSHLQLAFCDGAIYLYFDVPKAIYQGLLIADSKGAYFNSQIRNHFRFECLQGPE